MNARRDIVLALLVLACLACGWALESGLAGRSRSFSGSGISLNYPESWAKRSSFSASGASSGGTVFEASLQRPGDLLPLSFSVSKEAGAKDPHAVFVARSLAYAGELTAFRLIGSDYTSLGGTKALRFRYAFIDDSGPLPELAYCADYVLSAGDATWILSGRGDASTKDEDLAAFERVASSARFSK
jgi:hypothetical protein